MKEETKKITEKPQDAAAVTAAPEAAATTDGKPDGKKIKRSKKRIVSHGHIFVIAGFNNTLITITDTEGNTIAWSSAGACGFKGTKKSTPYAAQMAAESAAEKAKAFGFEKADVFVKGVGTGREQALRGIIAQGIEILKIADLTPTPHNGCKKPRLRRV